MTNHIKITKTKKQISITVDDDDKITFLTKKFDSNIVYIDQKSEFGETQTVELHILDLEEALSVLFLEGEGEGDQ